MGNFNGLCQDVSSIRWWLIIIGMHELSKTDDINDHQGHFQLGAFNCMGAIRSHIAYSSAALIGDHNHYRYYIPLSLILRVMELGFTYTHTHTPLLRRLGTNEKRLTHVQQDIFTVHFCRMVRYHFD